MILKKKSCKCFFLKGGKGFVHRSGVNAFYPTFFQNVPQKSIFLQKTWFERRNFFQPPNFCMKFFFANEGSSLKFPESGILVFFFNLRKNKKISTQPSMQTFLPLRKKHFHDFFFYIMTLSFLKRAPVYEPCQKFLVWKIHPDWVYWTMKIWNQNEFRRSKSFLINLSVVAAYFICPIAYKKTFVISDMWKFLPFFINFSQKLQSLKSLAVKYYYFLTEFQNSMSSVFFCFGPGLVFYSRKHKPKYLTKKAKAKLRMKQEHFFLFINICINEPMHANFFGFISVVELFFVFEKKFIVYLLFSCVILFCFILSLLLLLFVY